AELDRILQQLVGEIADGVAGAGLVDPGPGRKPGEEIGDEIGGQAAMGPAQLERPLRQHDLQPGRLGTRVELGMPEMCCHRSTGIYWCLMMTRVMSSSNLRVPTWSIRSRMMPFLISSDVPALWRSALSH